MSGSSGKFPLVSHVGIVVNDLQSAIETYRALTGSEPLATHEVPDQKVRVAMFGGGGVEDGRVELLQATSDDSPIAKYLAKRGEGLHHICIYVDDIEARLEELKSAGFDLIDSKPRIGAEGHRIAFVHPKSSHGVLIELEEKGPENS